MKHFNSICIFSFFNYMYSFIVFYFIAKSWQVKFSCFVSRRFCLFLVIFTPFYCFFCLVFDFLQCPYWVNQTQTRPHLLRGNWACLRCHQRPLFLVIIENYQQHVKKNSDIIFECKKGTTKCDFRWTLSKKLLCYSSLVQ